MINYFRSDEDSGDCIVDTLHFHCVPDKYHTEDTGKNQVGTI